MICAGWYGLASTKDTLVFTYAEAVEGITKLIRNGVSNDTFIAVIEQANTPLRVHAVNIYDFEKIQDIHFLSPSLVVVGRVAALHHEFAWLTNSEEGNIILNL